MTTRHRSIVKHLLKLVAQTAMLGVWLGCGASLPATVNGKISLDGKPPPTGDLISGTVTFYPVGPGAAAYGDIQANGTYQLRTGDSLGVKPGEYRLGVRLVQIEPPPPGGYKNAPGQKPLLPVRYEDPDQSGLQFTVAKGANTIDVSLDSKK